jgi:hypothetical protein
MEQRKTNITWEKYKNENVIRDEIMENVKMWKSLCVSTCALEWQQCYKIKLGPITKKI